MKETYNVRCPDCRSPHYWNRPLRKEYESNRSVMVSCRRCGVRYWISKGNDDSVIVSRRRE